jgi:glycosyltransferase involved in cell wall biosynthesis
MIKPKRSVIVIFDVQPLKAIHLPKDVGILPRSIAEKMNRDALLIAVQGSDRIVPHIGVLDSKVELRLVPQRYGHGEKLSSPWYALNGFSVAKALASEARSSDMLLIFHAHPALLLYCIVYKVLNPRGKIWLKLDMDEGGVGDFLRKRARFRLYLRCVNIVSAESKIIQKKLNDRFGFIRHIEYVPNCYDAERYPIDDGRMAEPRENIFLTVGRLGSYQKNNECFLAAISLLDLKKAEFRFIGESTPEFRYKIGATQQSSSQNIRFIERIDDRKALFCQYDEAKAFVLSSRYEGFALVLVEAMSHGCYIISTDLASARDIINDDASVGMIVPQDDPKALAEALRSIATMEIDHIAIAQKARRYYYENVIRGLPWLRGTESGMQAEAEYTIKPKVSIALASYNGERFIRAQLDSLMAQDYNDFEIVVSDDHSTDSTLSILNEYRELYPEKLRLIESARNEGARKNFEKAIRACTGEFVALCDQDDYWHPDKLQVLLSSIQNDMTLAFCDMEIVDEDLRDLKRSMWESVELGPLALRSIRAGKGYRLFLRENKIAGCSMMARREFLLGCLPFPEQYLHDEWIALLASLVGRIAPCPERLSSYRQHQAQQIGAEGPGFSESAAFVPEADYLAASQAGRRVLLEKLRELKADRKTIDSVAAWTRGRNIAEERRYARFSLGSVLASLWDGSYFKYLSGFKALGKDVLRLLRRIK